MTEVDPRRLVPRTDVLLADPDLADAVRRIGSGPVKQAIAAAQALVRSGAVAPDQAARVARSRLPSSASSLRPVLNATGVVLHTNLGRAALSPAAVEAVRQAGGYLDVEFDLTTGERARRGRGALAALAGHLPEAEDVLAVNNGAAALILATTALAAGREVVISRGELVEIGDGFRLPALIESTGARIREVGTTNRTSLADYAEAIGPATGCVLKVHPSNFAITGFTHAVPTAELAALPQLGDGVPLVVDVGSGLLRPDRLLPDEPDVAGALSAGADLVTCSGDKLLGGPQAGLLFGRSAVLGTLRRHPLARALRIDKLTLAGLEASLRGPATPTWRYLHADPDQLRRRCEQLADQLTADGLPAGVAPSRGAVGGGGAPGLELPGWAIALPVDFAPRLRAGEPAVVARIERGRCLVDLRCIDEDRDSTVLIAIRAAAAAPGTNTPPAPVPS